MIPRGLHSSDTCNASVPFVPIIWTCVLQDVARLGAQQMGWDGTECLACWHHFLGFDTDCSYSNSSCIISLMMIAECFL